MLYKGSKKLGFSLRENKILGSTLREDKKGVSTMIEYILLIAIVIGLSAGVYIFMKSFVPQEKLECPDGTSLFIESYSCKTLGDNYNLSLKLKNNGKFSVGAYFIKIGNRTNQEIATIDISEYGGGNGTIAITTIPPKNERNQLSPDEITPFKDFTIPKSLIQNQNQNYLLEIIPVRYQEQDNKIREVVCGDAKITQQIQCSQS